MSFATLMHYTGELVLKAQSNMKLLTCRLVSSKELERKDVYL